MDFKGLYEKNKDMIPYAIFGVLTTVVNIAVYWLIAHPLEFAVMPSTIIAWIAAVLFAYITNRRWVFNSEAHTTQEIVREIVTFFAFRLGTGVVDWACMFVFVDILSFNDVVIKFIANVIVIILNYVASKLIIFKHKKD
jgi:putative flippase GtrA